MTDCKFCGKLRCICQYTNGVSKMVEEEVVEEEVVEDRDRDRVELLKLLDGGKE